MKRHSAEAILAKLDSIANDGNWPTFDGVLGVFEYHAMRMVVVQERGGDDDWGLAFECVFGDFIEEDNRHAANVSTYLVIQNDPFGTRESRELELAFESEEEDEDIVVRGPNGIVRCTPEDVARLDLRPGMLCGGCDGGAESWRSILGIRAYLHAHPRAFWKDVRPLFRAECDVFLTSESFAHVVGRRYENEELSPEMRAVSILPSESPTFQSLAEAMASGDASRFVPGESNLDWRKWALIKDPKA